MTRTFLFRLRQLGAVSTVLIGTALFAVLPASAQVGGGSGGAQLKGPTDGTPKITEPVPPTIEPAQDAARSATEAARGATEGARDAARDAARETRDATRDARDAARTNLNDAARTTRDAARDVNRDARDAARTTRNAAQDATRDARGAVDRGAREARDATSDAARDARSVGRDAARDARDLGNAARQTTRDARNVAPRAQINARGNVQGSGNLDANVRLNTRTNIDVNTIRATDLGLRFAANSANANGLILADVAPRSYLADAGFVAGDQIISVGGQTIVRDVDFTRYLFTDYANSGPVEVVVMRNGRQEVVVLEPALLIEKMQTVRSNPIEQFGIILDDRYPDQLVVLRVLPQSPAFIAGLQAGDMIVSFHDQRLNGLQDFAALLEQSGNSLVTLGVRRGNAMRNFEVNLAQLPSSDAPHTALRPTDLPPSATIAPPRAYTEEYVPRSTRGYLFPRLRRR